MAAVMMMMPMMMKMMLLPPRILVDAGSMPSASSPLRIPSRGEVL
jgi:hypothetical protein